MYNDGHQQYYWMISLKNPSRWPIQLLPSGYLLFYSGQMELRFYKLWNVSLLTTILMDWVRPLKPTRTCKWLGRITKPGYVMTFTPLLALSPSIYIGLNVCCTHGQRCGVGDNNTQQRPDPGCGEDRQVQGDFFNQGLSLESSIISPVWRFVYWFH